MTEIKRLVDLVDRGPEDDYFFPASAPETIFRKQQPLQQNFTSEIVELGYQGHCAWGSRITIPIRAKETGDLLQWLCLRLKPRTWLGSDLERKFLAGSWDYADSSSGWIWANSLGSVAIERVEWEIGDSVIEQWGGEWMDVWSRRSLSLNSSPVWDADLFATRSPTLLREEPIRSIIQPTEDGFIYCWLPLTFLRRYHTAFPLISLAESTEFRVHITLRPFESVIRRRAVPKSCQNESPLTNTQLRVADITGITPIPWNIRIPSKIPDFDEVHVLAGVVHLSTPQRAEYIHRPLEMLYEPVSHLVYDIADKVAVNNDGSTVCMQIPLRELNGPIREILFFLRQKAVWKYSEWTNYGALLEDELVESTINHQIETTAPRRQVLDSISLFQKPLLKRARLMVDNAVFRDETEQWWRYESALQVPGGIRLSDGFVYGHIFGDASRWAADELQPASTVNASRSLIRLDLDIQPPPVTETDAAIGWELHVFAIGLNWMRFVNGLAGPLFKD